MELLYFWINDDHRTFKKIGFNLSSRFIFKPIINAEKREFTLEIKMNLNFEESFFGINISNVTAIVGDNGIGKSNLLDLISDFIGKKSMIFQDIVVVFWDETKKNIEIFYNLFEVKGRKQSWKLNVKAENDIEYKVQPFSKLEPEPLMPPRQEFELLDNTVIIKYSPIFDFRNTPPASYSKNELINISTNNLIYADSYLDLHYSNGDDLEMHKNKNIERQFELSKSELSLLPEINIPREVIVKFEKKKSDIEHNDLPSGIRSYIKFARRNANDDFVKLNKRINDVKSVSKSEKIRKEKIFYWILINLVDDYLIKLSQIKDILNETFHLKEDEFVVSGIEKSLIAFLKQQRWIDFDFEEFIELIKKLLFEHAITTSSNNEAYFILDSKFAEQIWVKNTELIDAYKKALGSFFDEGLTSCVHLTWRNVSSGEKAILDLYSRLNYAKSIIQEKKLGRFIYLLIDEGEHGFHPKWQKEYMQRLTKFIEYAFVDYQLQLILTTHSPIIISDIPKDNIIFIEKKDSKSVILESFKGNTFGSNIHKLYMDAFFMGEGLMGEFAKAKIQNLYNDIKNMAAGVSMDQCERYKRQISIIGEPLIKKRLTNLLESKITNLDTRIQQLESEIIRLKKERGGDV